MKDLWGWPALLSSSLWAPSFLQCGDKRGCPFLFWEWRHHVLMTALWVLVHLAWPWRAFGSLMYVGSGNFKTETGLGFYLWSPRLIECLLVGKAFPMGSITWSRSFPSPSHCFPVCGLASVLNFWVLRSHGSLLHFPPCKTLWEKRDPCCIISSKPQLACCKLGEDFQLFLE